MSQFISRELAPDALFRLKYLHDAKLSPDGTKIAYIVSQTERNGEGEETFHLLIMPLSGGVHRTLQFPGNPLWPRWSPDGKRIAFVGATREHDRLYVANADSLELSTLTPTTMCVKGAPAWSPDGSCIVFTVLTMRSQTGIRRITRRVFRQEELGIVEDLVYTLHLVDVRTGAVRDLETRCAIATEASFSPCGKRILFLGSQAAIADAALVGGLHVFTLELDDGRVTQVLGEGWFIAAAVWSPCGRRIVIAGDRGSKLIVPMARIWVVERDGTNIQCRTDPMIGNAGFRGHHDMPTWKTSQNSILSVPMPSRAYVSMSKNGCTEIGLIALEGPISYGSVASGLRSCLIMDTNARGSLVLYCASTLIEPWDLYVSDLAGNRERRLTSLNQTVLAQWPRFRQEHLAIESRDGMRSEGWIIIREGRAGPQPTVLFIHGGPMLSVGHFFRFDFHLLAANGYAVLFSNFRGSVGYGEKFMQAIAGDWGSRGFPDHMATVDAAVDAGFADGDRLGVWGPSHGGYATCWIVGHTSRFRAAVAESCSVNCTTMYYLSDAPDLHVIDLGGRPDEIPDVYRSRSPIIYASRCKTPTLLLHGEEDLRCPITEAEQFYRALHDAGCATELVRVPGMTHMGDSIGPLSARLGQNEALLEWFERHL